MFGSAIWNNTRVLVSKKLKKSFGRFSRIHVMHESVRPNVDGVRNDRTFPITPN